MHIDLLRVLKIRHEQQLNRQQNEPQVGMPIGDFTKEAMEGLDSGAPEFAVGMGKNFAGVVNHEEFGKMFGRMCAMAASRGM